MILLKHSSIIFIITEEKDITLYFFLPKASEKAFSFFFFFLNFFFSFYSLTYSIWKLPG